MIPRKLAEVVFQKLWLLAIPVIAIPIMATVLVTQIEEYESVSSIWVTPLDQVDAARPSIVFDETPAAENFARVVNELLGTRTFRETVAIRALLETLDGLEAAGTLVEQRVSVIAAGDNLVQVRVVAPTAAEARSLNIALLAEYQAFGTGNAVQVAAEAVEDAELRLTLAEAELTRRTDEAASWFATHPAASAGTDATYAQLVAGAVTQSEIVDSLRREVGDLATVAGAAERGALTTLDILDSPNLPDAPVALQLTERFMAPAAGLMFGLVIAAALAILFYRTDHTIRSSEDLVGLEVPLLGQVPELRSPLRNVLRRGQYGRSVAASIAVLAESGRRDQS